VRREGEVAALVAAAYGPGGDVAELLGRLRLIASGLNSAHLAQAMIAAVQLRLGEIAEDGLALVIDTEAALKANFNPAQLRDQHGWWTTGGSSSSIGEGNAPNHRGLTPAQEILPFGARPPLFFDEPPKTFRPYKEPIPRLSGREGAKNVPSWARGNRPYVGENGRDFAKRLMDDKYGRGNWNRDNPEYDKKVW
jgi:hypothetical protein